MCKRMVCLLILMQLSRSLFAAELLDKVVAVVNDNVITERELNEKVDLLRQQLLAKKVELPSQIALKKQVLQHLIDEDLQLQLAKNNEISIDNNELDETITKIAADNQLTMTKLREVLEAEGITWDNYRDNIRKELTISQIQQRSVGKTIVVSSQQVEDYLSIFLKAQKAQQRYHVENIVIPLADNASLNEINKARNKAQQLRNKIKPTDDFSSLAVAESTSEYPLEAGDLGLRNLKELPEVFANQVQTMAIGEISSPIKTGNGFQLIKLVAVDNDTEHHQVTKTHVRHILLKQDPNRTAAEASTQINNIYQQLKSGKEFSLMAKHYSLDAASAVKGGDLGWVTGDELVPQFAKAMNKLPLNSISKPVKTAFGWHIIQVLERKTEDDSASFQRQQVRQLLQQRKFSEAVLNWQQHIRSQSYIDILEKELA